MEHFFSRIQWTSALRCTPESNHWGGCRCKPYSNYWGGYSQIIGGYIPTITSWFRHPWSRVDAFTGFIRSSKYSLHRKRISFSSVRMLPAESLMEYAGPLLRGARGRRSPNKNFAPPQTPLTLAAFLRWWLFLLEINKKLEEN